MRAVSHEGPLGQFVPMHSPNIGWTLNYLSIFSVVGKQSAEAVVNVQHKKRNPAGLKVSQLVLELPDQKVALTRHERADID